MPFIILTVPTWNQKNLDYEIETTKYIRHQFLLLFLEIKRTSITRLKLGRGGADATSGGVLKSKEPRLRDWNLIQYSAEWNSGRGDLKSKEPRLRDWNSEWFLMIILLMLTWNQKNLDYEIETDVPTMTPYKGGYLEIKRTSITRLKRAYHQDGRLFWVFLKSKEPRLRDWNHDASQETEPDGVSWNQKNLDYEIETFKYTYADIRGETLEIKRTSITRLKHIRMPTPHAYPSDLKSKEPRLRDWNVYPTTKCCAPDLLEIKRTSITRLKLDQAALCRASHLTWNQKNLDYEIETQNVWKPARWDWLGLKSKEPRLRDWNYHNLVRCSSIPKDLKSKEPRLRDWN